MLTFGAYVAFLFNVTVGCRSCAIAVTAALGVASDRVMWRPMRAKQAGLLQLLLMAIGLAFVIRYGIQLVAGTAPRRLEVDVTSSIEFLGPRVGRTELIVVVVGLTTLAAVVLMLRHTGTGRESDGERGHCANRRPRTSGHGPPADDRADEATVGMAASTELTAPQAAVRFLPPGALLVRRRDARISSVE